MRTSLRKKLEVLQQKLNRRAAVIATGIATLISARPAYAASTFSFASVIDMLSAAITIGGAAVMVWGVVEFIQARNEGHAQGTNKGVWQLVSGAVIIAAIQIFAAYAKATWTY